MKDLHNTNSIEALDIAQKAKVEIHGILVDGEWLVDPCKVKNEFLNHFASRFSKPENFQFKLGTDFPNRLSLDQLEDLERIVTYDEIKRVV
ncbi:hypothetical protein Tco_1027567 [Tanacetum coccineum]